MAPETSRIDELRRRLQKDPASIAFAQLAEEYRRAGRFHEAVETCRAGLHRHPSYVSARVTLGRALLELGDLDGAKAELDEVLRTAPQNLAAIRGLAEIHRRRGELSEALEQYKSAFELAQNDPGIDQIVRDLRRELGPVASRPAPAARVGGTPAPTAGGPEAAAPPVGPVEDPAVVRARAHARRVVEALEAFLEAILAERRRRLYRVSG